LCIKEQKESDSLSALFIIRHFLNDTSITQDYYLD
jgi:hypothetical protein